jgi:hypothetical protein
VLDVGFCFRHGRRLLRQARQHHVPAAPVAFGFAVPPGVPGNVASVRFPRTVAPGNEDVAGGLAAKLIKTAGKTRLKVALHLRQNPATRLDIAKLERREFAVRPI